MQHQNNSLHAIMLRCRKDRIKKLVRKSTNCGKDGVDLKHFTSKLTTLAYSFKKLSPVYT